MRPAPGSDLIVGPVNRVAVCLLGPGRVGRALLQQIVAGRARLARHDQLRLCVAAIADSSGIVASVDNDIDDAALQSLVDHKAAGHALAAYKPGSQHVGVDVVDALDASAADAFGTPPILVDASAADTTASLLDARTAGWRMALANKVPLTGPIATFDGLTQGGSARWETTVASALPVVTTLGRLLDQGDEIRWITGALSGTMGYLTGRLAQGGGLSDAVDAAVRDGLAEPDPRGDLSGIDVARKALILARMAGLRLELADIATESLYPSVWNALDLASFRDRIGSLDDALASRMAAAQKHGAVLRYAATIGEGAARAGWITLDEGAPLARVDAMDSAVVFETSRFRDRPLVISGRGGGPETTAAGLLADVMDLTRT